VNLTDAELATVKAASFAAGDLRLAMTRTQRLAVRKLHAKRHPIFFLDCSRRWGKTVFLVLVAVMAALQTRDGIIRYGAPTKLHGRMFVTPAMSWACAMLPDRMRPRFVSQDNTWVFPSTGARIILGSCETIPDCDAQVGTDCHLAISDEGAKVRSEVLEYWHKTVILPQFLTTSGTLIVGSTPAVTPAHYLGVLRARAMSTDACVRFTIDDCDHISSEMKAETLAESGGPTSPTARRELYCEHVPDRDWLIVPEFMDVRADIVRESPLPDYRQWYTVADLGFHDMSVGLLAFYDFARAKIVVWDERVTHRESGLVFGFAVKEMESQWPGAREKSYRFADGTAQLLADIADETYGPGIAFALPIKDDSDASLNGMRMRVGRKQIEIHPRCKTLLAHLECGVWNRARSSYDRMEGFGHWDAIDALKYLCRMIDTTHNPTPSIMPGVTDSTHAIPDDLRDELQRARAALRFS
jgi:hypothetical protein